jgi:hypothetical protein
MLKQWTRREQRSRWCPTERIRLYGVSMTYGLYCFHSMARHGINGRRRMVSRLPVADETEYRFLDFYSQ